MPDLKRALSAIYTRLNQVEYLEVILAAIGCLWAWLLLTNFAYLPIRNLFRQNADVLYIEQIGRDLNSGGQLFQWRLTQAPYLFPDIAIARLLALLNWPVGSVAVAYHLIYGAALIAAWAVVLPGNKRSYFYWFAVLLYGVSLWGMLYNESVSPYFGLIGHHSGVGIFIPILYHLIWRCCRAENAILLFLLMALTFIGCISDGLILFIVVVPGLAYILIAFLHSHVASQTASFVKTASVLLVGTIFSRTFSYTNPFPQDREFFTFFYKQFPKLAVPTLRKFTGDLAVYFRSSSLAAFIVLAFVAAYCFLCWRAIKSFSQPLRESEEFADFCSFGLVCSLPLVLGSQIVLGLYSDIATSRQWAMLVFASILLAVYLIRDRQIVYRSVIMLTALFLVSSMYSALMRKHGKLPEDNPYEAIARCAMHEFPQGAAFVADYWNVRPLEMYSNGLLRGVPTIGTGPAFTNAGKVARIRTLKPTVVVTGFSIKEADFTNQYGPPDRIVCSQFASSGIDLLDYSKNESFKTSMATKAASAY